MIIASDDLELPLNHNDFGPECNLDVFVNPLNAVGIVGD